MIEKAAVKQRKNGTGKRQDDTSYQKQTLIERQDTSYLFFSQIHLTF